MKSKTDSTKTTNRRSRIDGEPTRRARKVTRNDVKGSRHVHTPTEVRDAKGDDTKVELSEEQIFGFDLDDKEDEIQNQGNDEGFPMFIKEEESSGSHQYTSNTKSKKMKKPIVSGK
ncbi:unnamed protein product [Lactuca saligna]|uniref:Uncharacterized protein n=1 Tax=Lactuca saligna TaxID=75948 RepID=A0AA36EG31_LACSI|nr:unnamed protein product [Lactuca saligna]